MEFDQMVLSRRTVHNYEAGASVSDEMVIEALRLSLWAPNHKLTFPWVYTLVGGAARARLAELSVRLKSEGKAPGEFSPVKAAAVRASVLNPSHLISLGLRLGDPGRAHEDYATLAAGVQIASLFLWQQGIASKWSTGGFSTHAETYRILGLNPAEVRLEGCLLVGMAAVVPAAPERPSLDQFLRRVE